MAFQVPRFNIWVEVREQNNSGSTLRGFSLAQLRAPRPNLVGRFYNLASQVYDMPYQEVLFPKGSDVRSYQFARDSTIPPAALDGDRIQFLGNVNYYFAVMGVFDVGVGFPNEFRVALCRIIDLPPTVGDGGMVRINPALVPAPGYTPLPVLPLAT